MDRNEANVFTDSIVSAAIAKLSKFKVLSPSSSAGLVTRLGAMITKAANPTPTAAFRG
jgi:hypothetical protein